MLHPEIVTKESDMLGAECALCKELFAPHDEVIECPVDGALHHTYCWEANGDHCTSLGCSGHGRLGEDEDGEISAELPIYEPPIEEIAETPPSSVPQQVNRRPTTQPSHLPFHLRIAQSCLIISIAIAIIVMAFSCFGLWAIFDYLMLEVFQYGYR